eukprot:gene10494-14105_t
MSMFSFMTSKSTTDSRRGSNTDASEPSTVTHTGFSQPADALFGGLDLKEDNSGSSGFSFLSSTTEPAVSNSAFSFISSETSSIPQDASSTEAISSFSFLTEEISHPPANITIQTGTHTTSSGLDFMNTENAQPQFKLTKTASSKPIVKKKKKSARVGFGREDEDDDNDDSRSVSSNPSSIHDSSIQHNISSPSPPNAFIPHPTVDSPQTYTTSSLGNQYHNNVQNINNVTQLSAVPEVEYERNSLSGYHDDNSDIHNTYKYGNAVHQDIPVEQTPSRNPLQSPYGSNDSASSETSVPVPAAPSYLPSLPTAIAYTSSVTPVTNISTIEKSHSIPHEDISAPISTVSNNLLEVIPSITRSDQTPQNNVSYPVLKVAPNVVSEASSNPNNDINDTDDNQFYKEQYNLSLQEMNKLALSVEAILILESEKLNQYYDLKQKYENCNLELQQTKNKIADLEAEQINYAQLEEFDKADAITTQIEELSLLVQQQTENLRQIKFSSNQVPTALERERIHHLSRIETISNSLNASKNIILNELEKNDEEKKLRFEVEEARLRAEYDRITMEKSHIEREEEALSNDIKVTDEAIRSQSGDFYNKRSEIEITVFAVQAEIRQLEEQLALKRNEETRLLKDVQLIDSRINEVKKKYDRQLSRIQDRKEALNITKEECLQEESLLKSEQDSFQNEQKNALHDSMGITKFIKGMEIDLSVLEIVGGLNLKENKEQMTSVICLLLENDNNVFIENENGNDSELIRLTETMHSIIAELQHLNTSVKDLDDEVENCLYETKVILENIPKLEIDKKSHATAKRFKEAAAVAKEIKDLSSRKEELDGQIESIQIKKESHIKLISETDEKLLQISEKLNVARKSQDLKRFDNIFKQLQHLKNQIIITRSKLQKKSLLYNDSSAAESVGDGGVGVTDICSVYLKLLEYEHKALFDEAIRIQTLHHIEAELVFDIIETVPISSDIVDENDDMSVSNLSSTFPIITSEEIILSEKEEIIEDNIPTDASDGVEDGQNIAEDNVVHDSGPGPQAEEVNNEELIGQAKLIVTEIDECNAKLQIATDTEDYDAADSIYQELESKKESLNLLLTALNMSEEELIAL